MPTTKVKDEEIVKCGNCPAIKTPSNSGRLRKGKWFCSWNCEQEYEQDINEESPFWRDEPI